MKKGFIFTILILLCSMAVFAETDFCMTMMHHLGPKSTTYGIELSFYTGNSASSSQSPALEKTFKETAESQYLGQIVGSLQNQTDNDASVYYNIYWTPFYLVKSDSTLDKTKKLKYKMTATPSSNAGTVDTTKIGDSMPSDALENKSMKIIIPKQTVQTKTVTLFEMSLALENPELAKGGDYEADLVMEVLAP